MYFAIVCAQVTSTLRSIAFCSRSRTVFNPPFQPSWMNQPAACFRKSAAFSCARSPKSSDEARPQNLHLIHFLARIPLVRLLHLLGLHGLLLLGLLGPIMLI